MFRSVTVSYLLLASLQGLVTCKLTTKPQECVVGIFHAYGKLSFEGIGYGNLYMNLCQNPLGVASMYAACKVYCSEYEIKTGMVAYNEYCDDNKSGPLLPESEVAVNTTDEAIRNMVVVGTEALKVKNNYTTPVLISESLYALTFRTEDDRRYERQSRDFYGLTTYGFWGAVLLIGIAHRLVTLFQESRLFPDPSHVEDNGINLKRRAPNGFRSLSSWVRKHIATASAIPPYRQRRVFGCTIPTRLESLVVYSYWAVSIILCAINMRGFKGNLYWSAVATQVWRYVSDRTGALAYANLPILWAFSGRNNIFIWLTGWRFSTFNLFHRHIARITVLESIVHSIGYTVFYKKSKPWAAYLEDFKKPWFYLGAVACVAMSFLMLFSFRFRHKVYDSFLLIHIALSVIVIVSLFYHTANFAGRQWDPYLWPVVAIWSFDRLMRLVRLVYCNIHVRSSKGNVIHNTSTTVTYREDANILEIHIAPATKSVRPGPGQHYFLYQPFRWTGWESHPFTLASWTLGDSNGPEASSDKTSFSFYVRPRNGWTNQLREKCVHAPNSTLSTTILLEGPYGRSETLWAFEEVLLVAGGSGITAIIGYLIDHARRAAQSKTRTRSITLVWAERKEEYVKLQIAGPLQSLLSREDINATFYITSSSSESPLEIATSSEEHGTEKRASTNEKMDDSCNSITTGVTLLRGRPDLGSIIEKAATSASDSGSRLAVFACGPAGMSDAAREATSRVMNDKDDSVQYFEETFGW
ncbi:ferric reductase NAD binding domain-containing protein [Mariannaea sp. PMI_226]|nr:ferric reductase NAD binding domain-containing protein [Mariannaea sp. PMI_226]